LAKLKEMGFFDKDVKPHDVIVDSTPEWESQTEEERALSARAMECYAGMVEGIDRNCGKVIDYLKSTGEYDSVSSSCPRTSHSHVRLTRTDTMIIFMSDNGAEGAWIEGHPVLGPKMHNVIERLYDNSLDNIGNHNSFVWYGQEWAQASTAPSRLYKMFTTEGTRAFLGAHPDFPSC
jgi:arylsulfatase